MVTEKDAGVEHDFERDPLLLRRSECGDWLTATGTTLVRSFCFWGIFCFDLFFLLSLDLFLPFSHAPLSPSTSSLSLLILNQGADNGIGVAAALALLDSPPDAKLPPLECLFTVDEETGLSGAFGLDGSMIKGVRLVNLDTEDWGDL